MRLLYLSVCVVLLPKLITCYQCTCHVQGRIQDFREGVFKVRPHTKSGGGSPLQVRYTKTGGAGPIYENWGGGGGGAIRFRSDTKRGGQFASGPIRKVGGGAVRFRSDIRKRGGGGGQSTSGPIYEKWGGGGGGQFASGPIQKSELKSHVWT